MPFDRRAGVAKGIRCECWQIARKGPFMYKIIGSDGKEYGPVSLDRIRQWVAEGRVNARTQVQAAGSEEWIQAADLPEISLMLAARSGAPEPLSAPPAGAAAPQKGLAITSL